MFQFEIDVQDDILGFAPGAFEQVGTEVLPFIDSDIRDHLEQEVNNRLAPYPGPVKIPIQWTNKKQKGYYFKFIAKRDSQGNIIPYQRTGGLGRAWSVTLQPEGILIANSAPAAVFVIGARQQQFHKNTGWPPAEDTIFDILVDVTVQDLIANSWSSYLESKQI